MREHWDFSSKVANYTLGIHRGPLPSTPASSANNPDSTALNQSTRTIPLEKVQQTLFQKLQQNWRRFWCCYLFWCIISLAIFLPVLYATTPPD